MHQAKPLLNHDAGAFRKRRFCMRAKECCYGVCRYTAPRVLLRPGQFTAPSGAAVRHSWRRLPTTRITSETSGGAYSRARLQGEAGQATASQCKVTPILPTLMRATATSQHSPQRGCGKVAIWTSPRRLHAYATLGYVSTQPLAVAPAAQAASSHTHTQQ